MATYQAAETIKEQKPKAADQYLENSVERFQETMKILEPEFSRLKDPVIYDIGGYGYLTGLIKKKTGFARVYDVSCADLNTLQLEVEDGSADVVLLCEVIEHLYNPDAVMRECRRILKKGGALVLTTPNLSSWFNRILLVLGFFPMNQDISCRLRVSGRRDILSKRPMPDADFNPLFDVHVRLYNIRTLELLMEEWGFRPAGAASYIVWDSSHHKISALLGLANRFFGRFPTLAQGLIVKAAAVSNRK